MPRVAVAASLPALLLAAAPAFAQAPNAPTAAKPPSAEKVRDAAQHFDLGARCFSDKDWECAASHFEAADAAVPSAKALRQAMRARASAGQGSRAATLAALALDRSASDEATAKLARETIDKLEPALQKVSVSCASPCVLAAGTRLVPGESNTRWVIYLDPGVETLSASFFGGISSAPAKVTAKAGGAIELRFEPEEKKKAGPAAPPVKADPSKSEVPPEDPKPEAPKPERKGISPAFFAVSLAVTAGLGGALTWSGIDTINNPGAAKVKKLCAGMDESCPTYQLGLAHQQRTNILIGATAGAGALTVLLAIFTSWRGDKPKPPAEPTAIMIDRGVALGARGVF